MDYKYVREKIDGIFKINNPDRIDGIGNQIYLSKEIEVQITKKFKVICDASECKIVFEEELNEQEKEILDIIVENHTNNV